MPVVEIHRNKKEWVIYIGGIRNKINVTIHNLDIITAALILTGQITTGGVFIQSGGEFSVSLSGPVTGGHRVEGTSKMRSENIVIDFIDILLAIFLLADQINVTGTFFASGGRFTIVIGGPLFGGKKVEASNLKRFVADFREYLQKKK